MKGGIPWKHHSNSACEDICLELFVHMTLCSSRKYLNIFEILLQYSRIIYRFQSNIKISLIYNLQSNPIWAVESYFFPPNKPNKQNRRYTCICRRPKFDNIEQICLNIWHWIGCGFSSFEKKSVLATCVCSFEFGG